MKNLNKLIATAIVLVCFGTSASAQTNNATANASARIVSGITIANSRHLNFGSISPGASGGTVTIAAVDGGTRTFSGTNLTVTNATSTSAKFTVTGEGSSTYAITRVPVAATALVLTSGSNTMNATLIVSTAAGSGSETTTGLLSGSAGATGTQDVFVGGQLTVGAAQAAGLYSNTGGISLTVNYN